jgi:DNA-directed RNA polymerase subunit beta'
LKTANWGYLTRRLVDVAQDSFIHVEDCGSERGIEMAAVIDAGEVIVSLGQRVLGRTAAEDVTDPVSGEVIVGTGKMIEERHVEAIEAAQLQKVKIRSVLTCETRTGVCATCYGRDLARGTQVNLGELVGVIAAQSIGEPGTQLTMRTFHIGGTAQIAEQSFIESNFEGTAQLQGGHVVANSEGVPIVMSRTLELVVIDADGNERAVHRLNYGTRLRVNDGDAITRGQRLAEWDPYTRPVITEVDGTVAFEDLVDGVSITETQDEATGITKREVADWRTNTRGADLKPSLAIQDKSGGVVKLPRGSDARYLLAVGAVLTVQPGEQVSAGDVLARIPLESAKTRDITGGLPRVAELFEARSPKDAGMLAEVTGTVSFGKDTKGKQRLVITDLDHQEHEYLIAKDKHLLVHDGQVVNKGEMIVDGPVDPHDLLRLLGIEELARYIIDEVQDVYRLQGVKINDKHIEVIVRQMLRRIEIEEPGDTPFIQGEQVERAEVLEENEKAEAAGKKPAGYRNMLLGITKASLSTDSFISAASFQETTRVLTEAAIMGKRDELRGLKENVIVGRLIPAGTGLAYHNIRKAQAAEPVLAEIAPAAAPEAAPAPAPQTAPTEQAAAPGS